MSYANWENVGVWTVVATMPTRQIYILFEYIIDQHDIHSSTPATLDASLPSAFERNDGSVTVKRKMLS